MPDESLNVVMDVKEEVKIPVAIELAKWHARSIEMEYTAEQITVTDDDEESMAISYLSKVKAFRREVTDAKNLHTAPFEKYVNRIKDMFFPIVGSADKAESTIKPKLLAYGQEKERKVAAERARLEAERKAAIDAAKKKAETEHREPTKEELTLPLVNEPPAPKKTVKAGAASATIVKRWKAKIVDPKAVLQAILQGRITIDVVEFNMRTFNTQAIATKKAQTIDGVEYYCEESLSAS